MADEDEIRAHLRTAIEQAETDPTRLAQAIGRGADYIRDYLSGRKASLKPDAWARIKTTIGFDGLALLQTAHGATAQAPAPTQKPSAGVYKPTPLFLGEADLPVFSAAEGGAGEMVVSTDPMEMVPRPWFLKNVREGYAVYITGESMLPAFEPGDMAIVNPRLPVMRGKDAIFVSEVIEGEFRATIKRLERWTERDWHVRQWNPPEGGPTQYTLARTIWPRALRVVGKYGAS